MVFRRRELHHRLRLEPLGGYPLQHGGRTPARIQRLPGAFQMHPAAAVEGCPALQAAPHGHCEAGKSGGIPERPGIRGVEALYAAGGRCLPHLRIHFHEHGDSLALLKYDRLPSFPPYGQQKSLPPGIEILLAFIWPASEEDGVPRPAGGADHVGVAGAADSIGSSGRQPGLGQYRVDRTWLERPQDVLGAEYDFPVECFGAAFRAYQIVPPVFLE